MSLCTHCTNDKLFIGCGSSCEQPNYEFTSDEIGTHTVQFLHQGKIFTFTFEAVNGVPFKIDNKFNECGETYFSIIKPSGANLIVNDGGTDYSCFYLRNLLSSTVI